MLEQVAREIGLTTLPNYTSSWCYSRRLVELLVERRNAENMTDEEAQQAAQESYDKEARIIPEWNRLHAGYRRYLEDYIARIEAAKGKVSEEGEPLRQALLERCKRDLAKFSDFPVPRRLTAEEYRKQLTEEIDRGIALARVQLQEARAQEAQDARGRPIVEEVAVAILGAEGAAAIGAA